MHSYRRTSVHLQLAPQSVTDVAQSAAKVFDYMRLFGRLVFGLVKLRSELLIDCNNLHSVSPQHQIVCTSGFG